MEKLHALLAGIDWQAMALSAGRIVLILLLGWVAMRIVRRLLGGLEQRLVRRYAVEGEPPTETAKRVETLTKLIRQAIRLSIIVIVALILLRQLGVEIGPLLAGVGVLGVALGFGAQNLVRDIIAGFFFILENQVRVGDVAIVNGTGGLVEQLNFRTIVLRDVSGTVHVFPNGSVTTMSNLTHDWSAYVFDIGVAYKEDTDRVVAVLQQVLDTMQQDLKFGPLIVETPEIFGVDRFGDSAVIIKGRIKTKPIRQWEVGREFLRQVKHAFDKEGIEIPFPHQTLYFGETSKPFELKLLERLQQNNPRHPAGEHS
ncbi:MAG TPA: mechanosensitive ion channel family protein [Mariprofundaceae bacterium]|nr:mechanosensitive ion channel family protein [Mariprofundaceae bacterium]